MQNSSPLVATIRRIASDGIAKKQWKVLEFAKRVVARGPKNLRVDAAQAASVAWGHHVDDADTFWQHALIDFRRRG